MHPRVCPTRARPAAWAPTTGAQQGQRPRNRTLDQRLCRALAPSALERWFARHEFSAPHLACCSDVQPITLRELTASIMDAGSLQAYQSVSLSYVDAAGTPELRAEVAARAGGGVSPAAVVTGVPQELAFLVTTALDLKPADRVVLQAPLYEGLTAVASAAGCAIDWWRPRVDTASDGGTTVEYNVADLEALLATGSQPPALVAFNFPHAPTGATLTAADFARAIAAARAAKARCVLSDEMYKELCSSVLPVAAALGGGGGAENNTTVVVSLGGCSKVFGCPGLRTGWLTFSSPASPLLTRVKELRDFTSVCPPSVTEALALGALRAAPMLAARGRALVADGDAALDAFCAAHSAYFSPVEPRPARSGSTRLIRLDTGEAAASFCERAVAEAGVLLLPATAYPACPPDLEKCLRVGVGRAGLPAALDALSTFVRGSPMRV